MNGSPRVAAVCGSLNDDSKTRAVLETALDAAAAAGAMTDLIDLRDYELLPYGWEGRDASDAVDLRRRVREADAVLLGTPVYHGSYSGALKNALDYCKRDDFDGTAVAGLAVAGGGFPGSTLEHLREVALTLDAWPLPCEVAVPNSGTTVGADGIRDGDIERRVRELGEALVRYAGVEGYPEAAAPAPEPASVD
ncbi:NAD(P)H-dependent oxidoreductase [Halostella sp. JP-L12]|uniref:NADPH-dependent FMN reductase n=1 Tax=Halostella TaxID=1843185 RepID=UPI000EF8066F|nr:MULTISPECIES: NAD(P)H-dependent oxidoreductase [Halostella]NHN47947.1 NAD(P)H-dependent oxidoreductase [Halostella sp. JP-L12]